MPCPRGESRRSRVKPVVSKIFSIEEIIMHSDGKEFDDSRAILGEAIGYLVGAFEVYLPESGIEPAMGPTATHSIGSKILDVMECFDRLQVTMGLPPGEEP